MPRKDAIRAGALLLLLVACSKPSEVIAAGSGTSPSPAQGSRPVPAAPVKAEPAPATANTGTAGTAIAPVPVAAGEVVDAQVLIWGGGRTPEEGRKALERFEAERSGLEAILSLGEGYPRVIASDTLPGLKPGFHVVMLGACKAEEAKEPLETLQAFKQGVYARAVKLALGPGSCPKLENGLGGAGTERLKEKPFELTAAAFIAVDPAASKVPWLVRLYLRDEKGDLVDQAAVDPRDGMWDGTDRNSCLPNVEAEGTTLRVTVKCDTLAGGPWEKERNAELKYRVTAGKIEWLSSPR